jgi:manganese transport protein
MLAYAGPGFLVSVGYMDPGNWATDLAGGSRFGYSLLYVILLSNMLAMLLQHLCVKLGVVTGRDLAQACRDHYSRPTVIFLWILCEAAIIACDLAELIGSAIALNLLFGIPLFWGCLITTLDVLLLLLLQKKGFRYVEALVITFVITIGGCFLMEMIYAKPDLVDVAKGFIPSAAIFSNTEMLIIAIGILGATVMPHNLYLHSSIVQTRNYGNSLEDKREAIRFATLDSNIALLFALGINASILIVSAAAFYKNQIVVGEIEKAYELLSPTLGVSAASLLFAIALLASGQSSTLTGTLAGQIVMEGFVNIRIQPWVRRLITRLLAVIPAMLVIQYFGESATTDMILWSQVILSMQLSFAIVPLIRFTSNPAKMGAFVNSPLLRCFAWFGATVVISLNLKLLLEFALDLFH